MGILKDFIFSVLGNLNMISPKTFSITKMHHKKVVFNARTFQTLRHFLLAKPVPEEELYNFRNPNHHYYQYPEYSDSPDFVLFYRPYVDRNLLEWVVEAEVGVVTVDKRRTSQGAF